MNRLLKIIFFFTGLCIIHSSSNAQTITGRVYDAHSKKPLPGANVFLGGTRIGAATNMEGKYTIENAPVGEAILKVKFIGYYDEMREITITSVNQKLVHNFDLSTGPSFANSLKYRDYHKALQKAFSMNPDLIELKVRKHKAEENLEVELEIVNNWDQAIYLPKRNFHLLDAYICELFNANDKPIKSNVVYCGTGAKGFYRPNDILAINAHSSRKLERFAITNFYLSSLKNLDSLKFRIKYTFDITKPLETVWVFRDYPSSAVLKELEDTYCKLLRLPLQSEIRKLKHRPFYKFW